MTWPRAASRWSPRPPRRSPPPAPSGQSIDSISSSVVLDRTCFPRRSIAARLPYPRRGPDAGTARAAETAGVVRRGAYVGPLGRQARVPKMPHLARRVAAEACGSASVHRGGRAFDDLGRLRLVALGAFIHRERREPRTVGDARSAAGPCWLGARLADVSDVAAGTGIARSSRGGTAEAT